MREMNITRFKQLVVGERFKLPGSDVLMSKETFRQDPELGCVNASYDIINRERPCYVHGETQVVRRRSNEGRELRSRRLKKDFGEAK